MDWQRADGRTKRRERRAALGGVGPGRGWSTASPLLGGEEYLLLERRTRADYYNRSLPAEGALLWHIRPHIGEVNRIEQAKLVELVSADGLDHLDRWAHDEAYRTEYSGNRGDATDVFDGVEYNGVDRCGAVLRLERRGVGMIVSVEGPAPGRVTQVERLEEGALGYSLAQNYPNPANPSTAIAFSLAQSDRVQLTVYNSLGQAVRLLLDGTHRQGVHRVLWDGRDQQERPAASGVYLYQFKTAGGFTSSRLLTLVR